MTDEKLKKITLDEPIKIGDTPIDEITVRKPTTGDLRGLQISMLQLQDVGQMATLLPRNLHFPMNHALYLGMNPHAAVPSADLIINLETDVPYMPLHARPSETCRVVHIGPDPAFQRYPRLPRPYARTAPCGRSDAGRDSWS